jgi:erythromycin esterase-like protein
VGIPNFVLDLRQRGKLAALHQPRLQRAIGVIYRPETERLSHYFTTHLPEQFDIMIHLDETRALQPLERAPGWQSEDVPETYPMGV